MEVIKCGTGLDVGILARGLDTECLMGIPMEDMAILGELYPRIAMLEEQERYLTSELDGVTKRLEELRK